MAASLAITGIAVSGTAVNLDTDAGDDYIVFGDGNFHTSGQVVWTRKSGGGSQISVGTYGSTPGYFTYNDSPRGVSWTGGTPNATGSGWINGFYDGLNDGGSTTVGGGFTITVPASTTKRRLRFYWGTWGCRVTVSASLSDSSASPVSNTTTIDTPSGGTGYVEIEYEAASASQTLLVNFFTNRVDQAYGNTTLQAATLKAIGSSGVTCNLAVTDTADTLSGAAQVAIAATLARTDTADTLSAAAQVAVVASLSRTDAADTLSSAAAVVVTANGSVTDTADSLSSTATVGTSAVICDLAVTDSSDSLAATAAALVVASLAASDAGDSLSATAQAAVAAALAVTDQGDSLVGVAVTSGPITATLAVTDADDSLYAQLQTALGAGGYADRPKKKRFLNEYVREVPSEQKPVVIEKPAPKAKAAKRVEAIVQKVIEADDEDEIEALMLLL